MTSKNGDEKIVLFENIVYSMKTKKISIENPINLTVLDKEHKKEPLSFLTKVLQLLETPTSKTIEIKHVIDNFENLSKEIDRKIEQKQYNIIDESDYDIISTYSQKELLTSLYESINEEDLDISTEEIKNYFKSHNSEIIKEQTKKKEKVSSIEKTLKQQREEISTFKKKTLDLIHKEILNEEKVLEKLSLEKKEHEKLFHLIQDKEIQTEYEKKLKKKEKEHSFQIKQLKLDEKLFKAKIVTLKNNLKAKKYKTIEIIPFFLTLGLIYWTSFSDTRKIILKYENKINKLKEKEIIFEKELSYISEERINLQDKNIERLKEITKKEDELQKKIEKLEKEITKQKNKIEKKHELRKNNEIEYADLIEQENTISKEYILQYEEFKEISKISEENLIKKVEDIRNRRKIKKQELQELINRINKQKYDYSKNILIKIKHKVD